MWGEVRSGAFWDRHHHTPFVVFWDRPHDTPFGYFWDRSIINISQKNCQMSPINHGTSGDIFERNIYEQAN